MSRRKFLVSQCSRSVEQLLAPRERQHCWFAMQAPAGPFSPGIIPFLLSCGDGRAQGRQCSIPVSRAELCLPVSCWSSVLCDFHKKPYLNEATADLIIAESSAFKVQSTSLRASVIPLLQINTVFKSNLSPDHPGSLTESLNHSCHLLKMIFYFQLIVPLSHKVIYLAL